jgi:hypothetical protein
MAWDIPKISMRPLGSHGYEFSSAFSVNEPRRHPEWHSDSLGPASKRAPDRQTTFPRPELRQCVGEAAGPPDRDSGSRFDASEVGFARVLLPGVEHCGSGGGEGRPDAVSSGHGLPAPSVDAERDVLAMGRDRNCDGKLVATKYQGDDPTKPIVMQRPACPIRRQRAMRLGRYERGREILLRMAGAVLVSVRRSCRRRP